MNAHNKISDHETLLRQKATTKLPEKSHFKAVIFVTSANLKSDTVASYAWHKNVFIPVTEAFVIAMYNVANTLKYRA